nr:immunoglobulin heavy chain junction region [Macaca mulatta]MOW98765.1 immunoglobulin heavy chain junction region [Macaca mulatta]MOW99203.1 immunoglobulin heavy chain junction region [Macaca mulatta]MOW99477.1 immunoglobulin heavy chain junction region [Macaca mulatta]MOW99502.1 immunoglobulin heavy chain junction region [Macaca mulatta]
CASLAFRGSATKEPFDHW